MYMCVCVCVCVCVCRYTDVTRKKKQPLDQVLLPKGWMWTTEWALAPEIVEFDPETAVDAFTEELWENQRFIPFKVRPKQDDGSPLWCAPLHVHD